MAANNKTVFILTYALLEWILIIMLLFNSIFSYLIRKFATYYTLKPPCVWCSIIDHLFDPNDNVSPYRNLICEAHATEFLKHYCSMNFQADRSFENTSQHIQVFDKIIPLEWTDSSTSCSRSSNLNGDEDEHREARFFKSSCCQDEEDKVVTIDSLLAELKAERLVVCGLYIELNEERKASAVAANQAMVMISRLQEQKVALQIKSIQNQRMMDEQAEYDHEVLQLLNELVMKLEKEKLELEDELEKYKEKVLDCEGKKKAKMMSKCAHVSCNITEELLVDTNVLDSKNLREHDESIVEFEIEKLWILDKLKELDETLLITLTDDKEANTSYSAWTRSMF